MKKKNKFIINIFVILIVLILVLYYSLKDNFNEIMDAIINMKHSCVIAAIITLCISRALIALTHYNVIKLNNYKVSYKKCLQINFIILFFHGITPFAGGGQPMEVYYLHKEHIPITKATNITLQNFIVYQIAFVLIGIIALLYNAFFNLFPEDHLIKNLVILGFSINIIVLVATFILSFGKKIGKIVCSKLVSIGTKLRIVKDEIKTREKLRGYLDSFYNNAIELNKHKFKVFRMIVVNMFAIAVLYSMPFFVALGFGIKLNFIKTIITTTYVMTIGSFIPIPGGTGGIEYGFIFFFGYLIKGSIVNAIMLMWRFVSYYLGMIFGGLALSIYKKED